MRSALARILDPARPVGAAKRERALERVLEQSLDQPRLLLDLERERALGEARRRRRPEQVVPLERAVGLGQPRQRVLGDGGEQVERVVERRRR